ncbi:hypothetical protein BH11ARM2_BH11ARM2_27070 [soil metagenome]
MFRRFAPLCLALVILGCGGGGTTGGDAVVVHDPSLIAVNVVPDASAVDIRLDDTKIGDGLAYQSASSLSPFSPGDYDLTGGVAGSDVDLWDIAQTLASGQAFAAIALGEVNYGDETSKRFRVVPVGIDRSVPNGSKARLIFVNAFLRDTGFETPAVDFQDGDRPQYPLTNVAYAGSSSESVDVGTYTFQARRNDSELVYAEQSITFEAGKIYLAILCGQENGIDNKAPKILIVPIPSY